MRRLEALFLSALVAGAAVAGDPREETWPTPEMPSAANPVNILSIGNSFAMYVTAGECCLADVAEKLGHKINHYCTFGPGLTISQHWQNRNTVGFYDTIVANLKDTAHRPIPKGATAENTSLMDLLTNGVWDVVTVQFASDDYAHHRNLGKNDYGSSWNNFSNLVSLVREKQPNAKILLQQTWGAGRNYTPNQVDGLPSIDKHDDNYEYTALTYNQAYHESPEAIWGIIPTGYAVQRFIYELPALTVAQELILLEPNDNKHLNHECGTALQAMVWCRVLFGDVPEVGNLPSLLVDKCGTQYLALMRTCALEACAPGVSYFDYGRGTVDFRHPVIFKNYDGTVLDTQSVTNFACAVAPEITTIDVGGETYEPTGWKSSPSAALKTSAQVNATKVADPITYTLQRKVVGEAGPERVWTGFAGNNSWANEQNWEPTVVPDENSDVTIPLHAMSGSNILVQVSTSVTVNSLTIGSGEGEGSAELCLYGADKTFTVKGDVRVKPNGAITSRANGYKNGSTPTMRSYTGAYKVDMVVGGNFQIDAGGKVDVTGCGYAPSKGFKSDYSSGGTYTQDANGLLGGAHGGNSSSAQTSAAASPSAKPTYGSIRRPVSVGSGGPQGNNYAFGGGAIHIVCTNGTMTVNGDILACGKGGTSNSASYFQTGAGGSVWLQAKAFNGTGSIDVRGGSQKSSAKHYGCGGSGRVAVYTGETNYDAFRENGIRVYAGPREAYTYGGANQNKNCHGGGTIYFEHAGHTPGCGDLLIDGNDVATYSEKYGTVISQYVDEGHDASAVFNSITIRNQGRLIVADGQKLLCQTFNNTNMGTKGSYSGTVEVVGATPEEPPEEPEEPVDPPAPPPAPPTVEPGTEAWFNADVASLENWPSDGDEIAVPDVGTWTGTADVVDFSIANEPKDGESVVSVKAVFSFGNEIGFDASDKAKGGLGAIIRADDAAYYGLAKDPIGGTNAWMRLEGAVPKAGQEVRVDFHVKTKKSVRSICYVVDNVTLTVPELYPNGWCALVTKDLEPINDVRFTGAGDIRALWGAILKKLGTLLVLL